MHYEIGNAPEIDVINFRVGRYDVFKLVCFT